VSERRHPDGGDVNWEPKKNLTSRTRPVHRVARREGAWKSVQVGMRTTSRRIAQGLLAAVLVVALCGAEGGCVMRGCTEEYRFPHYRITIVSGTTGGSICDADVTVNGSEAFRGGDCSYGHEIPSGTDFATVAASKPGFLPTSAEVSTRYDEDECGKAITKRVQLVLQRE
jgi:hypothetical protein